MGQTEKALTMPPGLEPTALPESLTWSATLDPHDEAREIEITDEMVRAAIADIEREQSWPFGGPARRRAVPPVARPATKADVIVFPGPRTGDRA